MKLENKVICFLGDSITEGHGTSASEIEEFPVAVTKKRIN